jgi:hypothetical protein
MGNFLDDENKNKFVSSFLIPRIRNYFRNCSHYANVAVLRILLPETNEIGRQSKWWGK